ncbi:MAG: ammonium transporter [Spirochaetia bacterium]|nr:ammonium transporter [Spirochaetia bacterium]
MKYTITNKKYFILILGLYFTLSFSIFSQENVKEAAAKTTIISDIAQKIDSGRTAWMLTSTAFVLLMIPGLALFYGGMVRQKNMLNTILMTLITMGIIGVEWVLIGYNMAFGDSLRGIVGWTTGGFGLQHISWDMVSNGVPVLVFVMFQGKFAIITPALISGAIVERVKFSSYVVFILFWSILIYNPLAHMVWSENGWLFNMGVLDFAGGTVVHISAGFSALALVLFFLKNRIGYPQYSIKPGSVFQTLLGAGLLWVGWFGFNAGSAIATSDDFMLRAGLAFTTTQVAASSAALVWIIIEWIWSGKPSSVGLASGMVAGLVAITPAAGHVSPLAALLIGALSSIICFLMVLLKHKFKYDDTLDVFGVHGMGGFAGALATGLFVSVGSDNLGLFIEGGSFTQFGLQVIGVFTGVIYAFLGTIVIAYVVDKTMGLRVSKKTETLGLDISEHGEAALIKR